MSHLLEETLERSAVLDPLLNESELFVVEADAHGLALLLAGPITIGTVAVGRVVMAPAVGRSAALEEAALHAASEQEPRLRRE